MDVAAAQSLRRDSEGRIIPSSHSVASRCPGIPTGFRPKAQGCKARATLGHLRSSLPTGHLPHQQRDAEAPSAAPVASHLPPLPCQPAVENALNERRQASAAIEIACLADRLGLGWIWVNRRADNLKADFPGHSQSELADQITSVARNNGRAKKLIGSLAQIYAHESVRFAVEDCAVHFSQLL